MHAGTGLDKIRDWYVDNKATLPPDADHYMLMTRLACNIPIQVDFIFECFLIGQLVQANILRSTDYSPNPASWLVNLFQLSATLLVNLVLSSSTASLSVNCNSTSLLQFPWVTAYYFSMMDTQKNIYMCNGSWSFLVYRRHHWWSICVLSLMEYLVWEVIRPFYLGWSDTSMSLSLNCNCLCLDDCFATRSMNHLKLCLLGSLLAWWQSRHTDRPRLSMITR